MNSPATYPTNGSVWKFLWQRLYPHGKWLTVALLLNCMVGVAITFQTLVPKYLLDNVLLKEGLTRESRYQHLFVLAGLFLAASLLGRMGLFYLSFKIFTRVREAVIFGIRGDFYRHIQTLCLRFHGNNSSGEMFSYLFGSPLTQVQLFFQMASLQVPNTLLTIISTFIWVATWDIPMTLILIFSVVSCVVLMQWVYSKIHHLHTDFQMLETRVSGRVSDMIRGTREIKLLKLENTFSREFEKEADELRTKATSRDLSIMRTHFYQEGISYVFFAALCCVGGYRYLHGLLTEGELLAYLTSFMVLQGPLNLLFQVNGLRGGAQASLDRIHAVLSTMTTTPDPENPVAPPARGSIEFTNVSFRYTDKPVLDLINFSIPYGQRVAFVGPSGGGKSTILKLVLRLYDPQNGRICLSGLPLTQMAGSELRGQCAIVPQDPYLFNGTIRENLRLVNPDASEEELMDACRRANAREFITKMPLGLDTPLGESGAALSGGQRQRLAIARAILQDAPYFLFDEVTSALDSVSEKLIQDSLEHCTRARTALFIAHRLSTIVRCDRVIVIDQGRIVQDGPPAELAAQPGLFQTLIQTAEH